MRRISTRTSHIGALSEINVTPLIDLAFTLLIIFMITTPLIENSMELLVPTSREASTAVDPGEVKTIEITATGDLRYDGHSTDASALETALTAAKTANPAVAIVVRPDRNLPVQRFIDVMDILKRADIAKVGVVTRVEE